MDHTDHFGFQQNIVVVRCNATKLRDFEESPLYILSITRIYFVEVSFQQLPCVRVHTAGILLLKKTNIPEILRHAHFEEIALLLIFGHSKGSQEPF